MAQPLRRPCVATAAFSRLPASTHPLLCHAQPCSVPHAAMLALLAALTLAAVLGTVGAGAPAACIFTVDAASNESSLACTGTPVAVRLGRMFAAALASPASGDHDEFAWQPPGHDAQSSSGTDVALHPRAVPPTRRSRPERNGLRGGLGPRVYGRCRYPAAGACELHPERGQRQRSRPVQLRGVRRPGAGGSGSCKH